MTLNSFSYRSAVQADLPIICDFQKAMAMESESLELDSQILEKGISAVLGDSTKGEYLIAEVDQQVVGSLLLQKEWSDWRNGSVLWIHSLYVIPGFRKLGIFSGFYRYIRARVESDSALKGIRLYVDQRNLSAQKAYHRMGMNADHYSLYEWLKN